MKNIRIELQERDLAILLYLYNARIASNTEMALIFLMTIHFAQEHFPNEQMFGIIETNIGSEAIPHGKPRHYYPL